MKLSLGPHFWKLRLVTTTCSHCARLRKPRCLLRPVPGSLLPTCPGAGWAKATACNRIVSLFQK